MPKKVAGSSDLWRTPQELWENLNSGYRFGIDLCASKKDSKCEMFCTDILSMHKPIDTKTAWINPPFSKVRAIIPHVIKVFPWVVGIYRCDNLETEVWQNHILLKCDWVFFFNGRIKYGDPEGIRQSPMFPSALFGKGIPFIGKDLNGVLIDLKLNRNTEEFT